MLFRSLAWWWFTRGDAAQRQQATPIATAAPKPAAPPASANTPKVAATITLPPAASAVAITATPSNSGGNETILSVLPARAPRASSNAASAAAATRVLDTPLPRSPAIDAAAPRVADATAGALAKPAPALSADPRVRCGERNFFSMLICLKRECQNPALSAHAECAKLREQEAAQSSSNER